MAPGAGAWAGFASKTPPARPCSRITRPPDPFAGLGVDGARRVLNSIEAGLDDGQRYTATAKAGTTRWAGCVLLDMGLGEGSAKSVIRTWIGNGLLVSKEYRNPVRRRADKGLSVDFEKMPRAIRE